MAALSRVLTPIPTSADLYLTSNVLIILDNTYMTRFWTLMEAWYSMKNVSADGVKPASEAEKRYTIACIHNAEPKFTSRC